MSFIQFMALMLGLQGAKALIFGIERSEKSENPFEQLCKTIFTFIVVSALSYYPLRYSLPFLVEMIKNV